MDPTEEREDASLEFITSGDLSRKTGSLLDRAKRGTTFLVFRHGRPIAQLAPAPRTSALGRPRQKITEEPAGPPSIELTPLQWRMLVGFGAGRSRTEIIEETADEFPVSDAMIAVTRLEMAGLARKELAGYSLTPLGRRALEQRRLANPPDRAPN